MGVSLNIKDSLLIVGKEKTGKTLHLLNIFKNIKSEKYEVYATHSIPFSGKYYKIESENTKELLTDIEDICYSLPEGKTAIIYIDDYYFNTHQLKILEEHICNYKSKVLFIVAIENSLNNICTHISNINIFSLV